ncbi:MAG: hypothetical protein WCY82_03120 [Desulfotomaculaceae bacterium]
MFFPFRLRRKKRVNESKEPKAGFRKNTQRADDYEHAAELTPTLSIPFQKVKLSKNIEFRTNNRETEQVNKFNLERNNEFIYGTTAGIIGAAVKYGFNELMQVLQIAKYDNNATSINVVMKVMNIHPHFGCLVL